MSIDKEKLKALAEAATIGRNYDRLDSAGGGLKYTCTGDDGSLVLQVDHKNDEFGFIGPNHQADEAFFLFATPAVVMSLLDEIEKLKTENEALCKAVKFSIDKFENITSGDGSGHADLARAVKRLAGAAFSEDEE